MVAPKRRWPVRRRRRARARRADDSDLWNLAPANTDALAEVDLAALRASPWSHALTESGFAGHRDESRRLFGYDIFGEEERLLAVMHRGRRRAAQLDHRARPFDPARVGAAFIAATPGATEPGAGVTARCGKGAAGRSRW